MLYSKNRTNSTKFQGCECNNRVRLQAKQILIQVFYIVNISSQVRMTVTTVHGISTRIFFKWLLLKRFSCCYTEVSPLLAVATPSLQPVAHFCCLRSNFFEKNCEAILKQLIGSTLYCFRTTCCANRKAEWLHRLYHT